MSEVDDVIVLDQNDESAGLTDQNGVHYNQANVRMPKLDGKDVHFIFNSHLQPYS